MGMEDDSAPYSESSPESPQPTNEPDDDTSLSRPAKLPKTAESLKLCGAGQCYPNRY